MYPKLVPFPVNKPSVRKNGAAVADDEGEWWREVQEFYRTLYVVCSWLEDGCSGNCKQEEVEVVVVGYSTPPQHYLQLVHYIRGSRNRGGHQQQHDNNNSNLEFSNQLLLISTIFE